MSLRSRLEEHFRKQTSDLTSCFQFKALESGQSSKAEYNQFIANVIRAHLKSPQILAFLYAIAPSNIADSVRHNMLEELGIEDSEGVAHPDLLRRLAQEAGLAHLLPGIEAEAIADLRRIAVDPILYGSLKEVGLAALSEVVAFEYMLSKVSGRVARALVAHRGLGATALQWFSHHSEVDIRHAEEGMGNLEAYIHDYAFSEEDAMTIVEMTLRENVFIRRYFRLA